MSLSRRNQSIDLQSKSIDWFLCEREIDHLRDSSRAFEMDTLSFFYKQLVYKQLAHRWQIAKQLLGLKTFSLNNNKNYRLKKI